MTTTIVKWGNSTAVRLPKPYLESLNLMDNDAVEILKDKDSIIIKKSEKLKHKTIRQRVEAFYDKDFEAVLKEDSYEFEEIDWGTPSGNEVW